jgi:tRNA U34 2-thiouridine synthase MnmA/TrmU
MKGIKEKKRIINHEICLEKERKYNDFSKRHLNYLSERLKMKNKLKDIHEQVKMNNIPDFYESDVFTITNLTTNEE